MKQGTSIISILHCIKMLTAVCLNFLYKQIKNMTNKKPSMQNSFSSRQYACSNSQEIPPILENLTADGNYKTLHIKM